MDLKLYLLILLMHLYLSVFLHETNDLFTKMIHFQTSL